MIEFPTRNQLAGHLPEQYFIPEPDIEIAKRCFAEFKSVLETSKDERPIQKYLQDNPRILAALVDGHLGRWVVPQKKLGNRYVPDFLIGAQDSAGMHWCAVELESPGAKMFNNNGDISAKLNHGIEQIKKWREWIGDNKTYAQRPRSQHGEGLLGIRAKLPGYVFIGRRTPVFGNELGTRNQLYEDSLITVHSYDHVLDLIESESGLWVEKC